MHIAILTFQGFNELDSFVALGVLNRVRKPDWRVTLCCPEPVVTSMNGVTVHAQSRLEQVEAADAVIVGGEGRICLACDGEHCAVSAQAVIRQAGSRRRHMPARSAPLWYLGPLASRPVSNRPLSDGLVGFTPP